jgi:hypothetical protein
MMQSSLGRRVAWLLVAPVLLIGCGGPQGPPAAETAAEPAALGDYLPPLDGGRIEVAPPLGWTVPPRNSKYLVRFTQSRQSSYPSLIIVAEDYDGLFNVSEQNVDTFAKQMDARWDGSGASAKPSCRAAPFSIGSFVGVTYRRRGRAPADFKKIIVDRLFLDTVVAGRRYTIELRTRQGAVNQYRPYLLAVAKGVKFRELEVIEEELP